MNLALDIQFVLGHAFLPVCVGIKRIAASPDIIAYRAFIAKRAFVEMIPLVRHSPGDLMPHPPRAESLQAYPNISTAAAILKVSASTLSRRSDLARQKRGERDVVIPAGEVLRLAALYRKRSLNDVAQELLEHAAKVGANDERRVQLEIEEFFEATAVYPEGGEDLLLLARRMLPADLCRRIEAALAQPGEALPDAIQGYRAAPDD